MDRKGGLLARTWAAAVARPVLALALVVAVQTLPALGSRDLWAGDEVRHGSALQSLTQDDHVLVLHMNGKPYPDKPPLYFLFVAGLATVAGTDAPWVFFLASALSAYALVLATLLLARRVGGLPPEASLVASLLVLATPLTALLAQTTRMDLLFTAFIVLSEVAFFAGFTRPAPNRGPVLGALFAVLAALTKGPLGLLLPVLATVGWLAWQGRLRRLLARDAAAGLGLVISALGLYAVGIVLTEGREFLGDLLEKEIWRRAADAGGHALPFWFYAAILPVAALPWTWLAVGLPWRRACSAWREAVSARRAGDGGTAYLVSIVVTGFLLLSILSGKLFIYVMPLFPALAVLAAGMLARMPQRAATRTWSTFGAAGLALAALLPFVNHLLPEAVHVEGLVPVAALLAASSIAVWLARRAPPLRVGALGACGIAAVALSVGLLAAPSLDPVMSPRAQAAEIRRWMDRGYEALAFKTYPGTYAYHAGAIVPDASSAEEVTQFVRDRAHVVLSMPRTTFDEMAKDLPGFHVVRQQWLADRMHVVAVKEGVAGDGSGPVERPPAPSEVEGGDGR